MKKFIIIAILLLLLIPLALSDGAIVIYDPTMEEGKILTEEGQFAAINYTSGIEKLIIAVNLADVEKGKQALWLFPVPAEPEKVRVDVLKGFPYFSGYKKEGITKAIEYGFFFAMLSLFGPFSFVMLTAGTIGSGERDVGVVDVYSHLEKMGMTVEVINAKEAEALYNYLKEKNKALPEELKPILEEYLGKNYSFVVAWISDLEELKQYISPEKVHPEEYYWYPRTSLPLIGVYVSFPTNKIYYPLKPTSVYGNKTIPITIYVLGHVTPELPFAKAEYFYSRGYTITDIPWELQKFFEGVDLSDIKYTKITMSMPAQVLTHDLWIRNEAPPIVWINEYLADTGLDVLIGFILFLMYSCLISLITGLLFFESETKRPSNKKLAIAGLFNVLTILGYWILAPKYLNIEKKRGNFRALFAGVYLIGLVASVIIMPSIAYVL